MRTVVVVDLVKGGAPAWPRLETDEHLMSTGSVRPLEDAFRISQHDLVTWAAELTGWDTLDALQLVSQPAWRPRATSSTPTTRWWPSWRSGTSVRTPSSATACTRA
jgi:hypothetical protein